MKRKAYTKTQIKKCLPTRLERDAIHEAIDFIHHNADGATNHKMFSNLQRRLRKAWKKTIKLKHLIE